MTEDARTPRSCAVIGLGSMGAAMAASLLRAGFVVHGFDPVPVAGAALQMYLMTAAAGMGKEDDASVARLYARIAGLALPGAAVPDRD